MEPVAFPAEAGGGDFTNVPLEQFETDSAIKKKQPRRVLHFSDGILEEYSTDEEEEGPPPLPPVDPKTLSWPRWFWYYTTVFATSTFSVADTCGEKLAWFFGITSPKYQSAIDEFYRLKEEEEKDKASEEKLRMEHEGLTSVDVGMPGKAVEMENLQKF